MLTEARRWLQSPSVLLETIDPCSHRRVKGLRLVTSFALAAMAGRLPEFADGPMSISLSLLASGITLWAGVSEARVPRRDSARDLLLLCVAGACGAAVYALSAPTLGTLGSWGPELVLVSGAFCTGYMRRFGLIGTGIGSQIFIGQLLAWNIGIGPTQLPMIALAGAIAAVAAIVPRLLSGPAEHPAPLPPVVAVRAGGPFAVSPELAMGLQGAAAALVVLWITAWFTLAQSAWGITAATYVIAGSATGTMERVRRRIIGTAIAVPIGLACLPFAASVPLLLWLAAAMAIVVYAMALPERYDIASGAYAFALVVTLAAAGEHSLPLLFARSWETALGAAVGLLSAFLVFPLRPLAPSPASRGIDA